jgi:hypothetical protein
MSAEPKAQDNSIEMSCDKFLELLSLVNNKITDPSVLSGHFVLRPENEKDPESARHRILKLPKIDAPNLIITAYATSIFLRRATLKAFQGYGISSDTRTHHARLENCHIGNVYLQNLEDEFTNSAIGETFVVLDKRNAGPEKMMWVVA